MQFLWMVTVTLVLALSGRSWGSRWWPMLPPGPGADDQQRKP